VLVTVCYLVCVSALRVAMRMCELVLFVICVCIVLWVVLFLFTQINMVVGWSIISGRKGNVLSSVWLVMAYTLSFFFTVYINLLTLCVGCSII